MLAFLSNMQKRLRELEKDDDWLADQTGISVHTIRTWLKRDTQPQIEKAFKIAQALGVSLEYLLTGRGFSILNTRGDPISLAGSAEFFLVPTIDQKVSAGPGQELIPSEQIGALPFLARMLRGHDIKNTMALEVRGDSMTGVNLFDGDFVVFAKGEVRDSGIYVIRIGDTLLVKRVQFDYVQKRLIIISDNPRYPERAESVEADGVEIVGKVLGWIHAHPY
jgi:phage repressor protein C with HTH and peptisase S24 domain